MSTTQNVKIVTMEAGENLDDKHYELLKLNSSGQVVVTEAATDAVVGVLAMNPGRTTSAGDPVPVALIGGGGVGLVKAAAAITKGQLVIPHATDGKAGAAANIGALIADQMAIGVALDAAGAADEVIRVLFQTIAAPHSA